MRFGDVPVESSVGCIPVMKIKQMPTGCELLCCSAFHVDWLLSAHIILMMIPPFSSSALAAVNTGQCRLALSWLHTPHVCQAKMTIWWCNGFLWIAPPLWVWSSNLLLITVFLSLSLFVSASPVCSSLINSGSHNQDPTELPYLHQQQWKQSKENKQTQTEVKYSDLSLDLLQSIASSSRSETKSNDCKIIPCSENEMKTMM